MKTKTAEVLAALRHAEATATQIHEGGGNVISLLSQIVAARKTAENRMAGYAEIESEASTPVAPAPPAASRAGTGPTSAATLGTL